MDIHKNARLTPFGRERPGHARSDAEKVSDLAAAPSGSPRAGSQGLARGRA